MLDSGEAVRVIARDPARLPERVYDRAEVVQGSHGDASTITKALAGADRLFWLVRSGASPAIAQDMAAMTEAQNDGICDAEPRGPNSATATSFRQWCQDALKPALQA